MITMKIHGGLGNQLFQYALGRNLSLQNNTELRLDSSFYQEQDLRICLLKYFNITENFIDDTTVTKIKKISKKYTCAWFLNKLNKKILYLKENPKKYFQIDNKIIKLNAKKNNYLDGYWQNENYFMAIQDVIRKEFTLKPEYKIDDNPIYKKIQDSQSISLHIRRTDYLSKENLYHNLSLSYYQKAIDLMCEKIKNPEFFIFSDDIEWAKENIKIKFPTYYVSAEAKLTDYQELICMSKCKYNIIANSSFSWWAAWLNDYPEKIVLAPHKWFNTNQYNTDEILPKNWIKI